MLDFLYIIIGIYFNGGINDCNENTRLTGIYNNAKNAMNAANTESDFKAAADTFATIPGFKDADTLAEQCLDKAEVCRKVAIYTSTKSSMTGEKIAAYETAIKTFQTISGWKNSDEQIYAYQKKIEEIKAKEELIIPAEFKKTILSELETICIHKAFPLLLSSVAA